MINAKVAEYFEEDQIFRIDHYLGKETVQNLMALRFSNVIFENLWDAKTIDNIQISISETVGLETRAGFYDKAGALRDMVQNHLLQLLCLVAMESPNKLSANSIRTEKLKVLESLRPLVDEAVDENVIRGQYVPGELDGKVVPGYLEELNAASHTETFVAIRANIDNWRWSGVPFYLRTGKNLPLGASEIRVQFRPVPNVLFAANPASNVDANSLVLRLQPNEGICLGFNGKVPGNSSRLDPVLMDFRYDTGFGAYTPEAYERLLLEAVAGDSTLFIRRDEVETAWAFVDNIPVSYTHLTLPTIYSV